MSVLRFDNVSKQYAGGHEALTDVSFEVAPGEMLFVTGHSGAGKSTLLKLIHLDERPSRGAVMFDERNLLKVRGGDVPRHRRAVGAVYQDHRLLMDRSIAENVALPLILRGTRRGDINKRVRSVLERMGLGHREKALPSQLSAGEQQRVGIARAIVGEPKTEPGLYAKVPLIQDIQRIDSRLLDYEAEEFEIIAGDQKRLVVDAYARFKIVAAKVFATTVPGGEPALRGLLDSLINSEIRGVLSSVPLHAVLTDQRANLMDDMIVQIPEALTALYLLCNAPDEKPAILKPRHH